MTTEVNPEADSEVLIGKVSGITIVCDHAIAKRAARWKKPNCNPVSDLAEFQNRRKDMKTYAIKQSLKLQDEGTISFSQAADKVDDSALPPQEFQAPEFTCGWAKRPKVGKMYGPKYMEAYREIIENLYNLGEADKRNKKSPAQMLEYLELRYPNSFCLPSENDLRTEINRLQTKKKSTGKKKNDKNSTNGDEFSKFIQELAANQPTMKPNAVVVAVKTRFSSVNPFPLTDVQIKSKFYYHKKKRSTLNE